MSNNITTQDVTNYDELFSGVDSDTILTESDNVEEKPSVLDVTTEDEELDKVFVEEEKTEKEDIVEVFEEPSEEVVQSTSSGLIEFFKRKIEKGDMFTFDDYDEEKQSLDEYLKGLSEEDLDLLYEENTKTRINEVKESVPKEFYNSLPDKLKLAADYVANGGDDLESMFSILAQNEKAEKLDPDTNSREITKQYLQATKFGTEEEINEQLDEWEDDGKLNKKAEQFKPKLIELRETIVKQKLQEQEEIKIQRQEAAKRYTEDVQSQLSVDNLGGVTLNDKLRTSLLQGLLSPSYTSISGKNTNELGYLLEKYQYTEPNHALIAEALWLLKDPEGYREKQRTVGKNETVETTVRQLKTEMGKKGNNSVSQKITRTVNGNTKRNVLSRY